MYLEANTAQGEAESCICLETHALIFIKTRGGALIIIIQRCEMLQFVVAFSKSIHAGVNKSNRLEVWLQEDIVDVILQFGRVVGNSYMELQN